MNYEKLFKINVIKIFTFTILERLHYIISLKNSLKPVIDLLVCRPTLIIAGFAFLAHKMF